MPARIGRVGDDGITTTQPSKGKGRVVSIAANGPYIGLLHTKEVEDFMCGHALDLVDVARSLVISIDFISYVGMSFGITSHKIRNLDAAHCLARSIFAGNQIDGLGLSPGIFSLNDVFDVADIHCHCSTPL